jgi:hypothetical protein
MLLPIRAVGPALGWIATSHSISAGLPLLALSFLALAPLFLLYAPDTSRRVSGPVYKRLGI